jgi:hypothetical protein
MWRVALIIIIILITGCGHQDPPSAELRVIVILRDIAVAEENFRKKAGRYGSLEELNDFSSLISSANAGIGEYNGYRFTIDAKEGDYSIEAQPIEWGVTGKRSFYTDQTRVIRQSWGPDPANDQSDILK